MNLTKIENFAKNIRRSLMEGVDAALTLLGFTDQMPEAPMAVQGGWTYRGKVVDDVEFGARWQRLKDFIAHEEDGRKAAVERAAYTWFNRLVAIRILAKCGLVQPQLEWADQAAHIPVIVHRMRTGGWKPNLTPGEDAALARIRHDPTQTREQFAILAGAFCRETPILQASFGEIDDWTMLLVPTNLLAEGGLVDCLNDATLLSDEDYRQDELIGWLYQYYIAERKAEVYDGFKKKKKAGVAEIPAATQIFTPDWIVKYLVENTLDSADPTSTSFLDPCCGSGHILLEGFRHLLAAYDELGYSKRVAVERIFANNLTGIDIDPRARQLSTFALLLAAAKEDDSFADAHALPRVFDTAGAVIGDSIADNGTLENYIAKTLGTSKEKEIGEIRAALSLLRDRGENIGSLLKLDLAPETRALIKTRLPDVEDKVLRRALDRLLVLTGEYDALVTNPPYLGAGNLNATLKEYLEKHYKDGKGDLFSAFILRLIEMCKTGGRVGMITMQSWMFLSSFEAMRKCLLEKCTILSMAHLGAHAFDSLGGEVTQTTAFVLANEFYPGFAGTYYRLVDGKSEKEKKELFSKIEPFHVSADNFKKIPGTPFAYWVSEKMLKAFEEGKPLSEYALPRQGIATGDNNRFLRLWYEVSLSRLGFDGRQGEHTTKKWYPCRKGGSYRRWYGNYEIVLDWENDGKRLKEFSGSVIRNPNYHFLEGITWTSIGHTFSMRYAPAGFLFESKGATCVPVGDFSLKFSLALCNTVVADKFLELLAPTLDFHEEIGRAHV